MSVCLFVSNKRQNSLNNRAQILRGPHKTPGKVYRWSKLQNVFDIIQRMRLKRQLFTE